MNSTQLLRLLGRTVRTARAVATRARRSAPRGGSSAEPAGGAPEAYPGDFSGRPTISYSPNPDGEPDPGEIVWTWVPFEEDHSQGKDRPVLVIGRDGRWLLALQLTSKDHDRDAAAEARWGRHWVDVGSGGWDRERRPSEARVDRVLRIDPEGVRRIGAVLDRDRFDEVTEQVLRHAG